MGKNRGREWPIDRIRQWIEQEGRTHDWCGNQLGCASQTIGKLCKRHGIRSQRRGPRSGPGHPNWRGGRSTTKDGYSLVWVASHPASKTRPGKAGSGGYVLEHRLVMERHLGRYLRAGEVVHHKNGDRADNRIENLEVFATNADHLRHELTGRVPDWSEDGKRRIREGTERRWREAKSPDGDS